MTGEPLLFFHDTSVLVNFHRAELIPVLGRLLGQNLRWTGTIRLECARKQRQLDLPGLVDAADLLLGDPIQPEDGEHGSIRQLRCQMASPQDHPTQHLGEAETITVIQKRLLRAVFLTDDRAATTWAQPIECVGTWKLIRVAHRRGVADREDAVRLWQAFVDAGGKPPRDIATRVLFEESL